MPPINIEKLRAVIQSILEDKLSDRAIAVTLDIGKSSVNKYRQLAAALSLDAARLKELTDDELTALLSAHPERPKPEKLQPDWAAIARYKSHNRKLTLQMLYNERYLKTVLPADIYASHQIPDYVYSYKTFVKLYNDWCDKHKGTGDFPGYYFNPGQLVEIDYAGDPLYWRDRAGNSHKTLLFGGVFKISGWIFTMSTPGMTTKYCLNSIIAMFKAAGGTTYELTCDNDTALVVRPDGRVGEINTALRSLLLHYRVEYYTAAVAHPRHKPLAENSVGNISRNIIQALMLDGMPVAADFPELNVLICEKVAFINSAPYSDKSRGSRQLAFEESERPALNPLPQEPFIQLKWGRTRTDAKASAVVADHRYRLPYSYKSSSLHYSIDLLNVVRFYDPGSYQEICRYDGAGRLLSKVVLDHPHFLDMARPNKEFIELCDTEQRYTAAIRACMHAFLDKSIETKAYGSFNQRVKGLCRLVERYDERLVDKACQAAIERKTPADYQFIKKYLELFRSVPLTEESSEENQTPAEAAGGAVLVSGGIFGENSNQQENNND